MIYTDGTIAINAGSPIVTGTGTQWKKNIHGVAPGQLISIENGTAPVSMMIRAVNSDTELVLSFNAPVTLSDAKYSIATTVPDTISDAARTMSANQGYIVYFLRAMQQWMTDTGQVEIELPNGQKVTLESVKALNKAIQETDNNLKGITDSITKIDSATKNIDWAGAHYMEKLVGAKSGAIAVALDSTAASPSIVANGGGGGWRYFGLPANGGALATREWVNDKATKLELPFVATDLPQFAMQRHWDFRKLSKSEVNDFTKYPFGITNGLFEMDQIWGNGNRQYMGLINFRGWSDSSGNTSNMQLIVGNDGLLYYRAGTQGTNTMGSAWTFRTEKNTVVDGNGFIKRSSPIIQIYPDGTFDANDESEGAEVRRTGTGQYHITGILGYNSDGAWGVNGGISVPKDNNGLELVYVADRVLEDGSIIIETCHRQHAHLPERFQNWRLKEVTPEGERIFYQDGEPCDLPESTRLDVRVEMPQGSVWNVKQRELAERMEREQAECEAQEAAEQAGDSEE